MPKYTKKYQSVDHEFDSTEKKNKSFVKFTKMYADYYKTRYGCALSDGMISDAYKSFKMGMEWKNPNRYIKINGL